MILTKLEIFWKLLNKPTSENLAYKLPNLTDSIDIEAFKERLNMVGLFKIDNRYSQILLRETENLKSQKAISKQMRISSTELTEQVITRTKELQKILLRKRILKRYCLVSNFLDKLSEFLDSDNRFENGEKLFSMIEQRLISKKDPYFLSVRTVLQQSMTRLCISKTNKVSFYGVASLSDDLDSLESFLCIAQNLSFMDINFADLAFNILAIPGRADPIYLDPRVFEMVAWVFESNLRTVNLNIGQVEMFARLLDITSFVKRVLIGSEKKEFLQKIYEVLLRLMVENEDEETMLMEAKWRGNLKNISKTFELGTFKGFYDKTIVMENRNFLRAENFAGLASIRSGELTLLNQLYKAPLVI